MDSESLNPSGIHAAVIREECTNGDREMIASLYQAGYTVSDYPMRYLETAPSTILDEVQVLVFAGGFSFSDAMGSANGWELIIRNNPKLSQLFSKFYRRRDTCSLGVCNGCQLMLLSLIHI